MSWRMQFFAPPKASGPAYVRDGLVLWLDGIWNAGVGVHDPNATTWVNLVDGTPFALSGDVSVLDNAMDFNRTGTDGRATGAIPLNGGNIDATVECCSPFSFHGVNNFWVKIGPYYGAQSFNARTYYAGPGASAIGSTGALTLRPSPADTTAAITYSGGAMGIYTGGSKRGDANGYETAKGASTYVGNDTLTGSEPFTAPMFCLRIYNRALSPDEIAQNYAVDKERFHL